MKKYILKLGVFTAIFTMGLFITACGGNEETHDHQHGQEQHDHDHEGHQHEQGQEESSVDKTGKEYTSAYICPMHCEDSGSETAGTCPVCGMDYVANEEHTKGGHKH